MSNELNLAMVLRFVDKATGPARDKIAKLFGFQKRSIDEQAAATKQAAIQATGYAASLYATLKPAIAFEEVMADVGKVLDLDPANIAALGDDIKELSTTTPMAATEIAKLVEAAAQGGVVDSLLPDDEERRQLVAFAEDAARMGVAFGVTADVAGSSMTTWRNQLRLTQEEAVLLGDAVNHISNNSSAAAGEILTVVESSGAFAKTAGLATNEIAALSAAFVSSSPSAEIARTALGNFVSALTLGEGATKGQKAAFRELGLDAQELAASMHVDAEGTIVSVLEAIGATDAEKQLSIINTVFGRESSKAIAPLVTNLGLLKDNFELIAEPAQFAGSMMKEYQTRAGTTANALQLATNTTNILAVEIGENLLPIFNDFLASVTPIISNVADFADANPKLTTTVMGLAAAMTALRVASTAHPILAVISAIVMAASLIYENWDGIVGYFQEKIDAVKAAFDEGLLQGIWKLLEEFHPGRLVAEMVNNIIKHFTGIDLYEAGTRIISSLGEGMMSVLTGLIEKVKNTVSGVLPDWVENGLGNGVRVMGAVNSQITGTASDAYGWIKGKVAGRATGGPARAGGIYRWMEEGEEMFSPTVDGTVISNRRLNGLVPQGPATSVTVGDINIYPQPGQSVLEIAQEVKRVLEEKIRPRGYELHDGGAYVGA